MAAITLTSTQTRKISVAVIVQPPVTSAKAAARSLKRGWREDDRAAKAAWCSAAAAIAKLITRNLIERKEPVAAF